MRRQRVTLADELRKLVGSDSFEIVEVGTGWPSLVDVKTDSGTAQLALHLANAGNYHRGPFEWRFQNPASGDLIAATDGRLPLLLGLEEAVPDKPILIALNGLSRLEKQERKRNSYLFDKRIVDEARITGWAEHISTTHDRFTAFHPRLLPAFVQAEIASVAIPVLQIQTNLIASGLLEDDSEPNAQRARRAASTLVRDQKFGRDVRKAYGERCAMCSLGLGLTAGAHIYPASAPGSADKVWNGLALCHNHHAAFDAHDIWISDAGLIRMSPALTAKAGDDPVDAAFIASTRPELMKPSSAAHQPRPEMFERRYGHYDGRYAWAL